MAASATPCKKKGTKGTDAIYQVKVTRFHVYCIDFTYPKDSDTRPQMCHKARTCKARCMCPTRPAGGGVGGGGGGEGLGAGPYGGHPAGPCSACSSDWHVTQLGSLSVHDSAHGPTYAQQLVPEVPAAPVVLHARKGYAGSMATGCRTARVPTMLTPYAQALGGPGVLPVLRSKLPPEPVLPCKLPPEPSQAYTLIQHDNTSSARILKPRFNTIINTARRVRPVNV